MQRGGGADESSQFDLRLFGCWDLRVDGRAVELGGREQRLLALLALRGRRSRSYVAGTLWPDTTEKRAQTSLRTAVLRSRRVVDGILDAGRTTMALAPWVRVDVHEMLRVAESRHAAVTDSGAITAMMAAGDLLPGWYDDWVIFERERLQHVRLRALESLAELELAHGRHDLALAAALEAIVIEPLRESGYSLAIRAHLTAGNRSAAVQQYQVYRARLARELGIAPTPGMEELLRSALPTQRGPLRQPGPDSADRRTPPSPVAGRRPGEPSRRRSG